ncbi:MAG: hypothetical protein HN380_19085, partial [Victivallales bacterium]|nr:hypothetical protein [Victivallales bacterium]
MMKRCLSVLAATVAAFAFTMEFDSGGFSVEISRSPLGKPSPVGKNVTIRAFPHAFIDDQFMLSQGQPGLLLLGFSNQEGVKIGTLTAFIELPKSIELLGVAEGRKLIGEEAMGDVIRYAIDATPTKRSIKAKGYNVFQALVLTLRTAEAPGTRSAATYWLTNDAYTSPRRSLTLAVIPRIEGDRPRRFETGVHFTANCIALSGEALDEYARFYAETGCNAAMIYPGAFSQRLRQMKIVRYHQPGWLVNGCMIGTGPRPDNVKFQLKDGKKMNNGVCPAVIYQREQPYFDEHLQAPLRKILVEDRETDHFLCNWEPFMFDFKGCFCDRCRADFATYAKIGPEKVAAVWPDQVVEEYRDAWIDFRGWQNARLVKTIEQTVNALGREIGRDAHFAPEVHIKSITQLWKDSASLRQYATMAYADKIPLLNAWGPYPWQTVMRPYNYVRGYNLSTHCLTRDSVDYVRSQIPESRRPRLLGFPHGLQGNLWTTEPESMAMDILTYFVNEYDGQLVYAFPKGYDARYWKALADANSAIAAFEDFTLDGTADRGHEIAPVTPYPAPSPRFLKAPCGGIDAKKWADASMLQSWEYRLGERRMVAVANYWQRGECFATLSFKDVKRRGRYLLREPMAHRVYGAEDGDTTLTGSALRDGVTVHVGAQRFAFFLLGPAREATPGDTVLRPSAVAAAKAARLPAIQKAFTAEKGEHGMADFARAFAKIGKLKRDGFEIKRIKNRQLKRDTLLVTTKTQTLDIDVLGGGRVRSWVVAGTELVSEDKACGLALDGLWHPAKMLTAPMEFVRREVGNGEARLVLRQPSVNGLPGLVLEKTLDIEGRAAAFAVRTVIRNTGEAPHEFSHRYHNMPVFLECRDDASGTATFGGATPAT